MGRLLRIGLTGGIASGKSTVARRFEELGVTVIDADVAARAVVAPGSAGLEAVVAAFGSGVLAADATLDRRALRHRVFADPESRRTLESLLHPLIRAAMERDAETASGPYLVLAIPLLIEGGDLQRVDRILVIDVAAELQTTRVMARDHTSRDQAQAVLAAQSSREKRLAAADDVLVNDGSVADLQRSVDALHERYLQIAAAFSARRHNLT